jgi:juvenile-hormone esterase
LTTTDKPKCLQRNMFVRKPVYSGDEDCLYLNVYRPVDMGHPLPVLVYFPHSDYMYGTGARAQVAPDIILYASSLVVVVAQFRVGLMGFFSTGDENVPGNMGLKDQEMVLHWLHDMIPTFNGDPDHVTVFGDATVMHQLLRPSILFDRAIISGSYLQSYFHETGALSQEEAAKTAQKLAVAYEYGTVTMAQLVEHMRTERIDWLMERIDDERLMGEFYFPLHRFGPTIEPDSPTAFFTESPKQMWREWEGDIPLLFGYSPYYGEQLLRGLENATFYNQLYITTREAVKRMAQMESDDRADDIIEMYHLKNMTVFFIEQDHRHNYMALLNDRYYNQPLQRLIYDYNENKAVSHKQLYVYSIMFDAEFNNGEVEYLFHNYDNDKWFEYNEDFLRMMWDFIEEG